uniref:Rab interacting lysosomal protein n=1 Tax=Sus scrofa TaxID=9823 RepID=A0A8W4FDS9_PIG
MEPRRVAPGAHDWGPRVDAGSGTAAELVYHLAGALGTELKELARRFGPEAAAGLVPLVVRALELLEKAAVGPAPDSVSHGQLPSYRRSSTDAPGSGHGGARALLRQLKEVTDRQRDELRAHNRDLLQRSQETEALQEQLQRLLLVNAELRHKLAAVETQLRAARDRESERELQREAAVGPPPERARGQAGGPVGEQGQEPERGAPDAGTQGTPENPTDAPPQPGRPPKVGQCSFSRAEVEQILQERNELKANVFLLKEELAYFQRELLTDHRIPGLLLEAMKVAVKKQRKKIKAKMLGTPEEAESSFGLWYRGEAEAPEADASSAAPRELRAGEEATAPPHLDPVGSLTAPSS